jgi:hypothetical protein
MHLRIQIKKSAKSGICQSTSARVSGSFCLALPILRVANTGLLRTTLSLLLRSASNLRLARTTPATPGSFAPRFATRTAVSDRSCALHTERLHWIALWVGHERWLSETSSCRSCGKSDAPDHPRHASALLRSRRWRQDYWWPGRGCSLFPDG